MRDAATNLATFLAANTAIIYRHLVKITLADATSVYWTDHTSTIVHPTTAASYTVAGTGTAPLFKVGHRRDPAGLEIGECELSLYTGGSLDYQIGGMRIQAAALADKLDRAQVWIERVYGAATLDPSMGTLMLFVGTIAEVEPSSTGVVLSLVDGRAELTTELPRIEIAPTCNNTLFDSRCGLARDASHRWDGTVTNGSFGSTARVIQSAETISQSDHYYDQGVFEVVSGTYAGMTRSVVKFTFSEEGGVFELDEPLPGVPAVGTQIRCYDACDRRWTTCKTKFSNGVHFAGFPLLPADAEDFRTRIAGVPHRIPVPGAGMGGTAQPARQAGFTGIPTGETPSSLPLPIVYGRNKVNGIPIYRGQTVTTGANPQSIQSVAVAIAEGTIKGFRRMWVGDKYYATATALSTNYWEKAPISAWRARVCAARGFAGGSNYWDWLGAHDVDYNCPYPYVAYWAHSLRVLAAGATESYSFEIDGFLGDIQDTNGDVLAVHVISGQSKSVLASGMAGFRWPVTIFIGPDGNGSSSAVTYCTAAGLRMSPVITERRKASEIVEDLLACCNCTARWSEGSLEIIALGDTQFSGNGSTFIPAVTPQYSFTRDHFLTDGTEDPISVQRESTARVVNCVPITYTEREPVTGNVEKAYVARTIESPDPADVARNGVIRGDAVNLPWITRSDVAMTVSRLRSQRSVKRRNGYTFKVWAHQFARLEPLDIVRLTEPLFGLTNKDVRILSIEEEDDILTIEAEDCPAGMGHAVAYAVQNSDSTWRGKPHLTVDESNHLIAIQNWAYRGGSGFASYALNKVATNGAHGFAAVGTEGQGATSDGGINWSTGSDLRTTIPQTPSIRTYQILWDEANSRYLAASSHTDGTTNGCFISTSPQGSAWTYRTDISLPGNTTAFGWGAVHGAAINGSTIVLGRSLPSSPWLANHGPLVYSTDGGVTWGECTWPTGWDISTGLAVSEVRAVVYSPAADKFFAIDANGVYLLSSSDGIAFSTVIDMTSAIPGFPSSAFFDGAGGAGSYGSVGPTAGGYGDGEIIFAGYYFDYPDPTKLPCLVRSLDNGATWEFVAVPTPADFADDDHAGIYSVVWTGHVWLAVGLAADGKSALWYSVGHGHEWHALPNSTVASWSSLFDAVWGGTCAIAVGRGDSSYGAGPGAVASSLVVP